jgi:hypothetical protein
VSQEKDYCKEQVHKGSIIYGADPSESIFHILEKAKIKDALFCV